MTSTALACTVKNYLRVVENLTADLRILRFVKSDKDSYLEINNNEVYYIHKTDVYFTFWY